MEEIIEKLKQRYPNLSKEKLRQAEEYAESIKHKIEQCEEFQSIDYFICALRGAISIKRLQQKQAKEDAENSVLIKGKQLGTTRGIWSSSNN
jgi:hypothetical protein